MYNFLSHQHEMHFFFLFENSQDPFGVAVGGTLGHCLCTGLAVIGGRMIAQKISVRTGEFCHCCCFFEYTCFVSFHHYSLKLYSTPNYICLRSKLL